MWCGGGGGARVPGIPYTRVENLFLYKKTGLLYKTIYYLHNTKHVCTYVTSTLTFRSCYSWGYSG